MKGQTRFASIVYLASWFLLAALVIGEEVDLLAQLTSEADRGVIAVSDCPRVADNFGELVNSYREGDATYRRLVVARDLGGNLHNGCREGIRVVEVQAGEDEVALEALYRSEDWYQVNRALAALRYWQAWLDLSLAQVNSDEADWVTDLSKARRGFEAASLRILYPGLVYGSWLGLVYVDQLAGEDDAARRRLDLLAEVLAADPTNPMLDIVNNERTMMAVRAGELLQMEDIDSDEIFTPETARLAEEQAFALLARHREQGQGAIAATGLLRRLYTQGFVDDRLFARMLSYQDEIVGHDMGPISRLLEAEFAYSYQQYETNVLKFRAFLAAAGESLRPSLDLYYYHYAVSLYQIELMREAQLVVDLLTDSGGLSPERQIALQKLDFIIAESLYQDQPDDDRAERLRKAAQGFISAAPQDPDAPSVWLALARITSDDTTRNAYLEKAAVDRSLGDSIRLLEFNTALAAFQRIKRTGDSLELRRSALNALELLRALPRELRKQVEIQVRRVQLSSVIKHDDRTLLKEIAALQADTKLTSAQARVLASSKLYILDHQIDREGLLQFISNLPPAGVDTALDHELYLFFIELQQRQRSADLATLSQLWLPKLASQPPLQRQVWLLQIDALNNEGLLEEALTASRQMLEAHRDSGDAWRVLAVQSEAVGDTFGAERAWAHIAAAEPEGSPQWLEVSMHRLRLLAELDDSDRGCAVQRALTTYNHRLKAQDQQRVRLRAIGCQRQPGGS